MTDETTEKPSKQMHVMFDKETNTWYGKKDHAERKSFANMPTQADAIERMREIAQRQALEGYIHRKDNNQIRERNSYGNDPYPPEG